MGKSVNIKVGDYQVLDSGIVLSSQNKDILFEIKDLNIRIIFKQDKQNEKSAINTELSTDKKCLRLILTNFERSLGIGLTEPAAIGTIDGNSLYLLFMVHALNDSETHLFSYTWLISKEK